MYIKGENADIFISGVSLITERKYIDDKKRCATLRRTWKRECRVWYWVSPLIVFLDALRRHPVDDRIATGIQSANENSSGNQRGEQENRGP